MGERQTIVIAGAGIGGLTAALAIAEAGFNTVVCERTAELSEIGAGIQLSPNAGAVLAGLRLDEGIAAAAIEPKSIDIRAGSSGRLIVAIPIEAFRKRYGQPYRVIGRADLQSILLAAVRRNPNVDLRLGATVVEFLAQGVGLFVRIQRAGGSEVLPAAALVGADGVWSALRERIGGARPARPTGRTAWRAVIPLDNAPPGLAIDRTVLWLGRNAHLVHYPIVGGSAINLVAIVTEDWDRKGWSAPGDRKWLAERFAGWCDNVQSVIAAPFGWQKWAISAVDPDGPWVAGAVALLGDAAHAMRPFLAQGAAMAIEDAAVLAGALAASPGDVLGALKAYEAIRKPRVERVAGASLRAGERYHFGPLGGALRDAALRLAGPRFLLGRNDWIYRWRPGGQELPAPLP